VTDTGALAVRIAEQIRSTTEANVPRDVVKDAISGAANRECQAEDDGTGAYFYLVLDGLPRRKIVPIATPLA
jgi:hypothetical protein